MSQPAETVRDRLARMKAERAATACLGKKGKAAPATAAAPEPEPAEPAKRVRPYVPRTANVYDRIDPKWRPMSGDAKIALDEAVERLEQRMKLAPATFKASLPGQDYKILRWMCITHKMPIPRRTGVTGGPPKPVLIRAIKDWVDVYELQRETAPEPAPKGLPGAAKRAAKEKQQEQETVAERVESEEEQEDEEPQAVGADAWTAFETLCGEVQAGNDSPVLRLKIRRLIAEVIKEGTLSKADLPALQEELGLKFSLA